MAKPPKKGKMVIVKVKNKRIEAPVIDRPIVSAITAEQMKQYNAKRKKSDSVFEEQVKVYIRSGLDEQKARKKAKQYFLTLALSSPEDSSKPKPVKRASKPPISIDSASKPIDPWKDAQQKPMVYEPIQRKLNLDLSPEQLRALYAGKPLNTNPIDLANDVVDNESILSKTPLAHADNHNEFTHCPICNVDVKHKNLEKHLKKHAGSASYKGVMNQISNVNRDTLDNYDEDSLGLVDIDHEDYQSFHARITQEAKAKRIDRTTGEKYVSFWVDKPIETKRYLLQVPINAITVELPFMGIEANNKNVTKWFDSLEEAVEFRNQLTDKVDTLTKDKEIESFSERWLRLFAEKGYSFSMIEAYKREAIKQGLTRFEQADFLSVVKPTKRQVIENHTQEPVRPVEAPVTFTNTTTAANDDKVPLEALLDPIIYPQRGYKIDIHTIGRDTAEQAAFRKAVSANFSNQCALTGDTVAVEAAHIQTHSDHYDNCIDNGIFLSVGLHRLFDAGIMVIDAETLKVHFTKDCFYKQHLEGVEIRQGIIPINKDKLRSKN